MVKSKTIEDLASFKPFNAREIEFLIIDASDAATIDRHLSKFGRREHSVNVKQSSRRGNYYNPHDSRYRPQSS